MWYTLVFGAGAYITLVFAWSTWTGEVPGSKPGGFKKDCSALFVWVGGLGSLPSLPGSLLRFSMVVKALCLMDYPVFFLGLRPGLWASNLLLLPWCVPWCVLNLGDIWSMHGHGSAHVGKVRPVWGKLVTCGKS
jgi:hypothetical protein